MEIAVLIYIGAVLLLLFGQGLPLEICLLYTSTEADVVCPAVTTEDPDGLLGDELLALQDLCRLLALSLIHI